MNQVDIDFLGREPFFDFEVESKFSPGKAISYRHLRMDILVNADNIIWPSFFVYMGLNYSEMEDEVFLSVLNELISECKEENPKVVIFSYGHFLRQGFSFHGDELDSSIHLKMAAKLMERLSKAFPVKKEEGVEFA